MPLWLFDFRCADCGVETERLVSPEVKTLRCSCGGTLSRLITPVRFSLEGHTGHFPTAADQWARQHEIAGKQPVEE